MHCRIRIKEHLNPFWQEWLDDMEMVHESERTTLLIGQLSEQAALYGVLLTILHPGWNLLSGDERSLCARRTRLTWLMCGKPTQTRSDSVLV